MYRNSIIQSPSPNFNERKCDNIDMIVIHYTDTKDIFESLSILQNPANEVSAHYLIDEDGTIYQLVDEEKRAWHAGISYWDGETDINSLSIGIELQNAGHTNGYTEFPKEQMVALTELCQDIIKRHNIPQYRILGHSDVAPDRKQDPGSLFDWQQLAEDGVGIWAYLEYLQESKASPQTSQSLKEQFTKFGYNPAIDEEIIKNAFKQHFISDDGQDIAKTIDRLNQIKNSLKR